MFLASGVVALAIGLPSIPLSAEDKEFADFSLKYGYSFSGPSERLTQNGGTDSVQKLPGEFKMWLNPAVDMFVRSDTMKAVHTTGIGWTKGVGDTVVGLDLLLRSESKRAPEVDFTYDAKLPTASGFAAGEIDHEAILSVLKSGGRHSFEADLGDYIEGFAQSSAAHSFELTLSDEIGLGKSHNGAYRFTTVQELDFTTSSPDTPTEAYQLAKLKYVVNPHVALAGGVRITYTPYTGRFGAYVTVYINGKLRRH
jgi:hypothetical protein